MGPAIKSVRVWGQWWWWHGDGETGTTARLPRHLQDVGEDIPGMHNNTLMQENVSRNHPYGSPFPGGGS